MAESQSSGVLDRIKPGIDLLENINLGLEIMKSLIDEVSFPNWIEEP